MVLCSKIRNDMFLSSWRRKLTDWGGKRFRIGVARLEECLDVIDFVISGIENICVMCRDVDEVIGRTKFKSW